jgi:hypothetical protein
MKVDFQAKLNSLSIEISKCKTYDEKLNRWARFTVEYCHNIAVNKIVDRSFYAFQSEPNIEKPEVLILGLNPQDMCDYKSQYENIGWGLKDSKMVPEVFIHQNPWYIGGKNAENEKPWNILKNLNKTIEVQPDFRLLFDNMLYMNILYFNSRDFSEFKNSFKDHWKEVFENCVGLSSLLIYEIIKPKRIICLGIDNCFKSFIGNTPTEEIIKDSLYKCKKNGFSVYGITHPSARKSNFSREKIGKYLYADWFNKPISNSIESQLSTIDNILHEIAKKYNLLLEFKTDKLDERFGAFKFHPQNENDFSFYFEFQKSFYSDLRYGIHKKRFIHNAIKCIAPYENWMNLQEDFNQHDFKAYFDEVVKDLTMEYLKIKELKEL